MNELNENTEIDDIHEKARNPKKSAVRLIKRLMKFKKKFVLIILSIIITAGLTIGGPLIIANIIDLLFAGLRSGASFSTYSDNLIKPLITLAIVYSASSLFLYLAQYLMADVSQKLTLELRAEISGKLSRLPLKYFDNNKKGDILSRATNDLEKISESLQEGLLQLFNSGITILAAIVIMFQISPSLTFLVLGTIAISIVITTMSSSKVEKNFYDSQQALGRLNGTIEEVFTGQDVIKAFNREDPTYSEFEKINNELISKYQRAQFSMNVLAPIVKIVGRLSYVIVAILGGIFVLNGSLTLGSIQAFIQYVDMCLEPTSEAAYLLSMVQSAVASSERVFDILDSEEELDNATNSFTNISGQVSFNKVNFGYDPNKLLMEELDINLNAGEKIAIVGPTGAGKTTLINLLMRFYDIQDGSITIDGVDIKRVRRGELRRQFGMVLQDTWLFHGTVQENLSYGNPDASLEDVIHAVKAARVHHFIQTLPNGYQTIIEEEGANLSVGERQLLTIARAILADPSMLILDEATSSVDTRTEAEIQIAMAKLMEGRTSFVIAHRLSTIKDADKILYMKGGNVLESGSHDELISKRGHYEELYNSQFANALSAAI